MTDQTQTRSMSIIDLYAAERNVARDDLVSIVMNHIMPKDRGGLPIGTKADMIAFLQIARRFDLDPWAGEIFLIPSKRGVKTYVSVDGYAKIATRNPDYDGADFDFEWDGDGKVSACTCSIWRKNHSRATTVTEFIEECYRDTDPWNKAPARMLRHKAYMQAVRIAFGITGAFSDDDTDMIDVTPPPMADVEHTPAAGAGQDKPAETEQQQPATEAKAEVPKPKRPPPRKPKAEKQPEEETRVIDGELVGDPGAVGATGPYTEEVKEGAIDAFVDTLAVELKKCTTLEEIDALWEQLDVDAVLSHDEDAGRLATQMRLKAEKRTGATRSA